ncbi:hypothetical protein ACHAW6_005261 [Cyclotella cf. meneghiniana]
MGNFMKGINPSLPLSVYTKQENCQDFATDAKVAISEETMVTTGTKHAIQCGDFTDIWKEWTRRPNLAKLENTLDQGIPGKTITSNVSRAVPSGPRPTQSLMINSQKMVTCLDSLANAAIQKNDTVKQLVNTNKQRTETIHNLQEQNTKILLILETYAGAPSAKAVGQVITTTESTGVWDPSGYCWTHGFKVKEGHTSTSCKT